MHVAGRSYYHNVFFTQHLLQITILFTYLTYQKFYSCVQIQFRINKLTKLYYSYLNLIKLNLVRCSHRPINRAKNMDDKREISRSKKHLHYLDGLTILSKVKRLKKKGNYLIVTLTPLLIREKIHSCRTKNLRTLVFFIFQKLLCMCNV